MKSKQDCLNVCHRLGLMEGDVVIIHHHPFLNDLLNKSATMIEALKETVGPDGTLVSYQILQVNQDPSLDAQIPFDKRERGREELAQFDFKKYREIYYHPTLLALTKVNHREFNSHPKVVVCAIGKYAALITKGQPLDFPFGSGSPFETLKELNAKVLIFGDDYSDAHELRHAYTDQKIQSIGVHGVALGNQWTKFNDYRYESSFYQSAIENTHKKEVEFNHKKIQSFSYQEALNQFINQHKQLFNELGQ